MKRYVTMLLLAVFFATAINISALAAAESKGERELTMEQAVDLTITNSKNLQQNRLSIKSREEMLKLAQDSMRYTPRGAESEPAARAAYNTYLTADMNLVMTKKSTGTIEDQIVYSVFSSYIKVLSALDNYYYAEANLKNEQKKLNIARVSYSVGIISKYELEQSEIRFTTTQKSRDTAVIDLNVAYVNFDTLLGINVNERPILTEKPGYSLLVTDDVEKQIIRVIENNPQIWEAERKTEIAVIQRDLLAYNSESDTFYNRTLQVDSAELAVTQAKDGVRQTIRNIYNEIIKAEEQYVSAQEGIRAAENTLNMTRVRYAVGLATENDVYAAEVALMDLQKNLNNLVYQHELAKIGYDKPWAM